MDLRTDTAHRVEMRTEIQRMTQEMLPMVWSSFLAQRDRSSQKLHGGYSVAVQSPCTATSRQHEKQPSVVCEF